jgi:hypothetical protein
MKRRTLAIVLITVIALPIVACIAYYQINAPNVKITAFNWIRGFNPYAGLTFINEVKVTVENHGINEISGITLTVKLLNNGTEIDNYIAFVTQIETLHAGESREISGNIFWGLLSTKVTHRVCTLKLGDIVLDEWTEPFTN